MDVDTHPSDAERVSLRDQINSGAIDGYIWLSDDAIAQRKITYSGRSAMAFFDKSSLSRALTRAIAEQQLAARGISSEQVDDLFKPVKLEMVRMENGAESKSSGGMFFLIIGMVMLLYAAVLFYGISVMRSILEEKNTRILEVLLSSATRLN